MNAGKNLLSSNDKLDVRIKKVLDHINSHLDETLSLSQLSELAHLSRYHFHRQFTAYCGISLAQMIRRLRLRRACYQLLSAGEKSITQIALEAGFENPESFSRFFRQQLTMSPSQFRKHPHWPAWLEDYPLPPQTGEHPMQVEIIEFPATKLAAFEHQGDPATIYQSVASFIQWRKANRLPPTVSRTFNLLYDDPAEAAADQYRMDICAATDRPVADNAQGVVRKSIPGGRCARLRHIGPWNSLGQAVSALYRQWLPESGEQPRDFPLFVERVNLHHQVPEQELISDIYLPLK